MDAILQGMTSRTAGEARRRMHLCISNGPCHLCVCGASGGERLELRCIELVQVRHIIM
jgi:hypothetical protein